MLLVQVRVALLVIIAAAFVRRSEGVVLRIAVGRGVFGGVRIVVRNVVLRSKRIVLQVIVSGPVLVPVVPVYPLLCNSPALHYSP